MIGQQMRSEFERNLPEYERDALDRARSGIHPLYMNRISAEEAKQYVNARLPDGDPGRMR